MARDRKRGKVVLQSFFRLADAVTCAGGLGPSSGPPVLLGGPFQSLLSFVAVILLGLHAFMAVALVSSQS